MKGRGTCFYFGEVANQSTGEFYVEDAPITANIKIFNQSGLLVNSLDNVLPRTDINAIDEKSCRDRNAWWDGRNHWGHRMANGVYLYKVTVRQDGLEPDSHTKISSKRNTLIISR
jgi:hypothetical protein